jgi:hypothetical protein
VRSPAVYVKAPVSGGGQRREESGRSGLVWQCKRAGHQQLADQPLGQLSSSKAFKPPTTAAGLPPTLPLSSCSCHPATLPPLSQAPHQRCASSSR